MWLKLKATGNRAEVAGLKHKEFSMKYKEYKRLKEEGKIRVTRFDPEDRSGQCLECGAYRTATWPKVLQADGTWKTQKVLITECDC